MQKQNVQGTFAEADHNQGTPRAGGGGPSSPSLLQAARSWSTASSSWAEHAFRRGTSLDRRVVGWGGPEIARAFSKRPQTPDSLLGLELSKARLLQPTRSGSLKRSQATMRKVRRRGKLVSKC